MSPLAARMVAELRERPRHFAELVEAHDDVAWRELLHAWGEVRAARVLARTDDGRYRLAESASP